MWAVGVEDKVRPISPENAGRLEFWDGMSKSLVERAVGMWTDYVCPKVYDIEYEDGRPRWYTLKRFDDGDVDRLVEFFADKSLTHRLMAVDRSGSIFITRSEDGTTNIDADVLTMFANAVERRNKLEEKG